MSAISPNWRAAPLLAGAVLLLGAVLVLSGCEQGPGTPPSDPSSPHPPAMKVKPALAEAVRQANDDASDDHGDQWETATGVKAGSSTTGTLTRGDTDLFVITVSEPGILSANTTGGTDTVGSILQIRDENTYVRYDFDDDGGDGFNFYVSATLHAGTYYIRVRGYDAWTTGDYTLLVRFAPIRADDHSRWRSSATKVTADSATRGTLTPGDVDLFTIKVGESGTLSATTAGNTDTFGVLHDSLVALASDDDGGVDYNFWVSASVKPGTHYIEVKGLQ